MNFPVFIINLPSQTTRRVYMVNLMKKIGISDYIFVTPVDVDPQAQLGATKAQRSLTETNILLMQMLSQSTAYPYVLVFEDDVVPKVPGDQILPRLAHLISQMPHDWDMLFLEYCNETCLLTTNVTKDISRAYRPFCTAAILYNTKSLNKIWNILSKYRKEKSIDKIYANHIYHSDIIAYIATPSLFSQNEEFTSSIDQYLLRYVFGYRSCNTRFLILLIISIIICCIVFTMYYQ